jgi:hypothetical protein
VQEQMRNGNPDAEAVGKLETARKAWDIGRSLPTWPLHVRSTRSFTLAVLSPLLPIGVDAVRQWLGVKWELMLVDSSNPDIWSSWQTKTAVFGALLTALLAVFQAAAGLMQRRHELRLKQAETGTKLVEEMLQEADDALVMLDSDQAEFELDNGHIATITSEDVTESLRQPVSRDDDKAIFVREGFDTLLYYLERFEHAIEARLVRFADVQTPTEYYLAYMAAERALFERYIEVTLFRRVPHFLGRFSVWTKSPVKPSRRKRPGPGQKRATRAKRGGVVREPPQ